MERPKLPIAPADLNVDQRLVYLYDQVKRLKVPTTAPVIISGGSTDTPNEMVWRGAVSLRTYASVTVPGTSKPWNFVNGGLNTTLQFANSTGGTAPVVVDSSLNAGDSVTITYVSGTVSIGVGQAFTDAGGNVNFPTGGGSGPNGVSPSAYCPQLALVGVNGCTMSPYSAANPAPALYGGGLCGSFVNDAGVVIGAIAVGNGGTFIVPPGATTLQLGINDDAGDNSGSFAVSVKIHSGVAPSYASGDVILFENMPYVCTAANPHAVLPPNTSYWIALLNKATATIAGVIQLEPSLDSTKYFRGDGSWGGVSGGSGSTILPAYPIPSALSGWTWVNQGSATARQVTSQAIEMNVPDNAALNWRALKTAAPATPYKVQAALRSYQGYANSQTVGIYFLDGSNKMLGAEFLSQTGGIALRAERINSPTSDNATMATLGTQSANYPFSPMWTVVFIQLRNDGASLYFDWSMDGENFTNFWSESVGSFITPAYVGFGGISVTSNAANFVKISLLGWQVSGNATL